MDARARDGWRMFQGSRFLAAYAGNRKKLASRLGVSVQAVDRHASGRAAAISYEQLAEIAADPQANPYSVLSGGAAVIHEMRAKGDAMQLAGRLHDLLHIETERDGKEDCSQERVVGVLGGGTGTHRDTFELVWQAEKYGARLALFGRKINMAEHQPSFVRWMRAVADGNATPVEAIHGYHGDLAKLGLVADRCVDDDLLITEEVLMAAAAR